MISEKDGASSDPFREAIESAEHLQWKVGLQAIKKGEGAGQIVAENSRKLLGGATVDGDCKAAYPNASRWDYVIGYRRTSLQEPVAYFVEVHSAETSEVSRIAAKFSWLQDFLQKDPQAKLARLSREYHWIASGRVNIPKNTPQFRFLNTTLRKKGLRGPVKHLTLA